MTASTLTAAETRVRTHVLAINLGYCAWCGTRPAENACHRLPEGQEGPYLALNLIPGCGSGTRGCHWRTEQRRALSYACGWLIRGDDRPDDRNTRIAATPALIRSQLAPHGAWHFLDSIEDGHPLGMPRLAEPDEVPAWMWPHGFEAALAALWGRAVA
jgi:hypothetical protein